MLCALLPCRDCGFAVKMVHEALNADLKSALVITKSELCGNKVEGRADTRLEGNYTETTSCYCPCFILSFPFSPPL